MALDLDPEVTEGHRPVFMAVLGLLLIAGGGFLLYTDLQQPVKASQPVVPDAYHYEVTQSANANVTYLQSSFFNNGPTPDDQTYVMDLTKSIETGFHYHYKANKSQALTYSYGVNAIVKATYTSDTSSAPSNVWSKNYVLIPSKETTDTTDSITLDPQFDVPYAEYKKATDEFKQAFAVPTSAEMDVIAAFHVKGIVNGVPFSDDEVQKVSAPLDQVLYKPTVKLDKSVGKDVAPVSTKQQAWNISDHYLEIVAGVLLLLGLVSLVYGLRKQIFKSPYQRELDRIYRYYDGIVIRANKPADVEGKNVVSVASFDDMLNLEEEMKLPIVASPAGSEAMHFVIMKDNDVFIYTLGKPVLDSDSVDKVEEFLLDKPDKSADGHKKSTRKVKIQ